MTPVQRTLAVLKGLGLEAEVVEKWVPFRGKPKEGSEESARKAQVGGFRKDVWGFGDILVLDGQPGSLLVNACGQDVAGHLAKYQDNPVLRLWLQAGNRFQVWGWRKVRSGRGTKEMVVKARVVSAAVDEALALTWLEEGDRP